MYIIDDVPYAEATPTSAAYKLSACERNPSNALMISSDP